MCSQPARRSVLYTVQRSGHTLLSQPWVYLPSSKLLCPSTTLPVVVLSRIHVFSFSWARLPKAQKPDLLESCAASSPATDSTTYIDISRLAPAYSQGKPPFEGYLSIVEKPPPSASHSTALLHQETACRPGPSTAPSEAV